MKREGGIGMDSARKKRGGREGGMQAMGGIESVECLEGGRGGEKCSSAEVAYTHKGKEG